MGSLAGTDLIRTKPGKERAVTPEARELLLPTHDLIVWVIFVAANVVGIWFFVCCAMHSGKVK